MVSVRRGSTVMSVRTSRTVVSGGGGGGGEPTVYEHTQATPSASWTVNHNMGRRPAAVSVLSPGGVEVEAAVTHTTLNQLVVAFSSPQTGSVRAF